MQSSNTIIDRLSFSPLGGKKQDQSASRVSSRGQQFPDSRVISVSNIESIQAMISFNHQAESRVQNWLSQMDSMHHLVQREVESREIQAKTNKSLIDSPIRGQQTTASNRPFQKKRTVSITHVGDSLQLSPHLVFQQMNKHNVALQMLIRSLKEVSDRGGYQELLLSSIEHLPLLRNLVLKQISLRKSNAQHFN